MEGLVGLVLGEHVLVLLFYVVVEGVILCVVKRVALELRVPVLLLL
jgi:hypothetical protein